MNDHKGDGRLQRDIAHRIASSERFSWEWTLIQVRKKELPPSRMMVVITASCSKSLKISNMDRHTEEHNNNNKREAGGDNSKDQYSCNTEDNDDEQGHFWFKRIELLVSGLCVLKGITYPLFKVTMVALASKLLKEVLRISLDHDIFVQVEQKVFESVSSSSVSIFLMESLNFYQTFVVSAALVFMLSIIVPFRNGLSKSQLNYMEVKRLQLILYDKFMMEPNSVDLQEAQDLVYSKIASIENYWTDHKFMIVDDITTIIWSLFLFLVLAWDLGLIYCGTTIISVFVTKLCWIKLSRPWSERREQKMSETNGRLLDLVSCQDVVLSHTMEHNERVILQHAINSDRKEMNHLVRARVISECIEVGTFTMMMPLLCLYVYSVDLTMERVFQFLIVLVVTDECIRAYLSYLSHEPHVEEFKRAKKFFVSVLGMDEVELFPHDFACHYSKRRETFKNAKKTLDPKKRDFPEQCIMCSDTGASGSDTEKNGGLKLENVSLGYTGRNKSSNIVVENLSLSFPIGSHKAIMGESGTGKSIVFKSIAGLIPLLNGNIFMGGRCIDTTSCYWREQVAAVSQDSVLFNRSLRENLTYGMSSLLDDKDILDVLNKVHLKDLVLALPKKLDTMVHHNGNEFSGGERQRMQIARLLLSTCPVILLDEMTSALDPNTTIDVVNELKAFAEGKTLIMITHNVQTLHLVERVFQMKKTGLVSTTRPSALLRASSTKKASIMAWASPEDEEKYRRTSSIFCA